MPAFQFYNPAPVLPDLLGLQPAFNGTLTFYDIGTTDLRNTWSDPDLTILNTNPVLLGPDARTVTPIFCDGDYTAVLKDFLGATVWTRDIVSGQSAGQTIPTLDTGKFLTNDGSNLLWQDVRQLPDPSGSVDYYVTTDGEQYLLQPIPAPPEIPDPEIVIGTKTFRAGVSDDETKYFVQAGNGTATSTGTKSTSVAVSFPTPFSAVWFADVAVTVSSTTPSGALPTHSITGLSTTGFTANFNIPDDDSNASWKFSADVLFNWIAHGTKEVAA